VKLASITFLSLAFSYWIDYLGFITEGKLAVVLITPSLGVSNWSVIYIINTAPLGYTYCQRECMVPLIRATALLLAGCEWPPKISYGKMGRYLCPQGAWGHRHLSIMPL
jgi:hypothetical protein